jgi:hypothetical protein
VKDRPSNANVAEAGGILRSLGEALERLDVPHGALTLSRPPKHHARSTIYFVGEGRRCRWVVKSPHEGASQEDLATPLSAECEYEALRRLTAHFATVTPQLAVPRPVAYLHDVRALAMEYVNGTGLDRLVRPRRMLRADALLAGVALSAWFVRHLHALEPQRAPLRSPGVLAEELLELAEEKMHPAGLVLPPVVVDALRNVARTEVPVGAVRLHGDFAPVNMLLDGTGSVTGLDPNLTEVGPPEDDLARFLMMLLTQRLFLLGSNSKRTRALREAVQAALREAYAGDHRTWSFLELYFIRQLCLRWLRRHNTRIANRPAASGVRERVVDRYFALLLAERAEALVTAPRVGLDLVRQRHEVVPVVEARVV